MFRASPDPSDGRMGGRGSSRTMTVTGALEFVPVRGGPSTLEARSPCRAGKPYTIDPSERRLPPLDHDLADETALAGNLRSHTVSDVNTYTRIYDEKPTYQNFNKKSV